jgi:hypothetical protein
MQTKGFQELLDSDEDTIRAFALMSLRSSLGDGPKEIEQAFAKENLDPRLVSQKLLRLAEEGLHLIYLRNDRPVKVF